MQLRRRLGRAAGPSRKKCHRAGAALGVWATGFGDTAAFPAGPRLSAALHVSHRPARPQRDLILSVISVDPR